MTPEDHLKRIIADQVFALAQSRAMVDELSQKNDALVRQVEAMAKGPRAVEDKHNDGAGDVRAA